MNIYINVKAAIIIGILYFFVMEMEPVKIILRSLTFEEYAKAIKKWRLHLIILMIALFISEGGIIYFV